MIGFRIQGHRCPPHLPQWAPRKSPAWECLLNRKQHAMQGTSFWWRLVARLFRCHERWHGQKLTLSALAALTFCREPQIAKPHGRQLIRPCRLAWVSERCSAWTLWKTAKKSWHAKKNGHKRHSGTVGSISLPFANLRPQKASRAATLCAAYLYMHTAVSKAFTRCFELCADSWILFLRLSSLCSLAPSHTAVPSD